MKKTIIAAGGIVKNPLNEILMIYRRGKWDLPKGKLDDGESIEACAVREVEEETGIKKIVLGNLIGKTYHEYFDTWQKEEVIKETFWFEMEIQKLTELKPQLEEDIEIVEWVSISELKNKLENTYNNIEEIIVQYLQSK